MTPYKIKAQLGENKYTFMILADNQKEAIEAVKNELIILEIKEEPTQIEQKINENFKEMFNWFI